MNPLKMYTYRFEKLDVWAESKKLTKEIYLITQKCPFEEKFGLTTQITRATNSICSNIAKGSERKTNKYKAQFTNMAFSSAAEVLNQITLVKELDVISLDDYIQTRLQIESITSNLNALENYQINT
jgi:four helix bundle protein